MAEILVFARASTGRPGAYARGDVVHVAPDGHDWGRMEGPPDFVRIKVPGLDPAQVRDRIEEWRVRVAFSVLSHDPATDTYQVRATSATDSASGRARLTRDAVEGFLTRWGAVVDAVATNRVDFTARVRDVLRSEGAWGPRVGALSFTLDSYDASTGGYEATVDVQGWSSLPDVAATVRWHLRRIGAEVTGRSGWRVSFRVTRDDARRAFLRAVRQASRQLEARRRYYFAAADVDQAVAMGGVVTLTATQLQAKVLDRMAE